MPKKTTTKKKVVSTKKTSTSSYAQGLGVLPNISFADISTSASAKLQAELDDMFDKDKKKLLEMKQRAASLEQQGSIQGMHERAVKDVTKDLVGKQAVQTIQKQQNEKELLKPMQNTAEVEHTLDDETNRRYARHLDNLARRLDHEVRERQSHLRGVEKELSQREKKLNAIEKQVLEKEIQTAGIEQERGALRALEAQLHDKIATVEFQHDQIVQLRLLLEQKEKELAEKEKSLHNKQEELEKFHDMRAHANELFRLEDEAIAYLSSSLKDEPVLDVSTDDSVIVNTQQAALMHIIHDTFDACKKAVEQGERSKSKELYTQLRVLYNQYATQFGQDPVVYHEIYSLYEQMSL